MATSGNLFRLLSEFIVLLLGALLILLAATGRIGLPARPAGVYTDGSEGRAHGNGDSRRIARVGGHSHSGGAVRALASCSAAFHAGRRRAGLARRARSGDLSGAPMITRQAAERKEAH